MAATRVQMAGRGRQVDRLHRVARDHVADVQALGEPEQIAVVGEVAGDPAALEVGDVRRAADHAEIDRIAADRDVALGIAGVQGEFFGCGADPLLHESGVEAYPRPVRIDVRASLPQDVPRLRQQEIDPDLGQHAQRGVVDRLDLIRREDLEGRIGIVQLTRRGLARARVPLTSWSAAGSRHPRSAVECHSLPFLRSSGAMRKEEREAARWSSAAFLAKVPL